MENATENIGIGSCVFVYAMGCVRLYQVIDIYIIDTESGLKGEVKAKHLTHNGGETTYKFFLDSFIKGINEAKDKKVSEIDGW